VELVETLELRTGTAALATTPQTPEKLF